MSGDPGGGWDYEALRSHIQAQIDRLASENEIRHTLTQEELDRRFAGILREIDQRFGQAAGSRETLARLFQEEIDRRFAGEQDRLERQERVVDQRFAQMKEQLDERYATQTKALDKAFDASAEAVQVALSNAEKATQKAEAAAERRFDSVNEFRQTLSDQALSFLTRAEYDAAHGALADRVTTSAERMTGLELRLTSRLDTGQGTAAGAAGYRTEHRLDVGTALTAASVLIGLLIVAVALYAALHK